MANAFKTPVYVRESQKKYYRRKLESSPEYAETLRNRQKEWLKEKLETDIEYKEKYIERIKQCSKRKRIQRKTSTFDELFQSEEYKQILIHVTESLPDVTDTPEQLDDRLQATLTGTHIRTPIGPKTVLEQMVTSNKRQPMSILKSTIFHVLREHLTYDRACELLTIGKPTLLSIYKALTETLAMPQVDPEELAPKPVGTLETSDGTQTIDEETLEKILELLPHRRENLTQIRITVQ